MTRILTGECLCGAVKFRLEDRFPWFHQCHCKQCQQLTGTAFASNLFTEPGNIEYVDGAELVAAWEHQTREFSSSFCKNCGSNLPFLNKSGTSLIVPAGSLNELPDIQPQANIFAGEEAPWLEPGRSARKCEGFAPWRD
ncbi:MAG: hypothetical protein DHS20C12_15690 [Pseudohongiella sp.]|nr:MAG: hypothetical protein DHS20C12_15690 [Pseudohongiella sp.]